jgi:hypothetical protein
VLSLPLACNQTGKSNQWHNHRCLARDDLTLRGYEHLKQDESHTRVLSGRLFPVQKNLYHVGTCMPRKSNPSFNLEPTAREKRQPVPKAPGQGGSGSVFCAVPSVVGIVTDMAVGALRFIIAHPMHASRTHLVILKLLKQPSSMTK